MNGTNIAARGRQIRSQVIGVTVRADTWTVDELFLPLLHAAKSANQSPEERLVENLDKQLNADGVDLRRHFGAVDLG